MADLNLDGTKPTNPVIKDDDAKHIKRKTEKQIDPPAMIGQNFKVEFGNVDRATILMLEYVNRNLVALTNYVKLLIPEDKLKSFENKLKLEVQSGGHIKQGTN